MLLNYFKTAWRNLTRNKTQSFINLCGLSVGLSCSLLILLWVQDELGVDAYHANGDRLYKVYEREYYSDHTDGNYDTPGAMAEELEKKFPEVADAFTMEEDNQQKTLQVGSKILKVEGTAAGPGIFRMLSYPLLQGTPATALSSTLGIALSAKTAGQFFGSPENAMGKTIRIDNKKDLTVTAVFRDLPVNTSQIRLCRHLGRLVAGASLGPGMGRQQTTHFSDVARRRRSGPRGQKDRPFPGPV